MHWESQCCLGLNNFELAGVDSAAANCKSILLGLALFKVILENAKSRASLQLIAWSKCSWRYDHTIVDDFAASWELGYWRAAQWSSQGSSLLEEYNKMLYLQTPRHEHAKIESKMVSRGKTDMWEESRLRWHYFTLDAHIAGSRDARSHNHCLIKTDLESSA